MTITEAAEQVLLGQTLEEKLTVQSLDLDDAHRGQGLATPAAPMRPAELRLSENGVRASFPGVNVLDQDRPRGEMLHFLANHELLASELMALVLLKFPNAPAEYRRGVYEAMREEQMHTLMYLRRMRECGVEFGQLPLNSYFWRLVSPMESPMEFVTKLNLTFEQANLDFSHYYAQQFRQVGDTATAAVLEKIYQDEIGHVGHGVKWLREWKSPEQSDWTAYNAGLELPFSASKAKGLAPYNPDGRRAAGLDDEFITKLAVYSQSRGRNPVVHWSNPNAESYAHNPHHSPSKIEQAIELDLELLMLAACKQDDLLLLRQLPTVEHLTQLRAAGIPLPELIQADDPALLDRKLGGLSPWAWTPDASAQLAPYREQVAQSVPEQWRPPLDARVYSKELGIQLTQALHLPPVATILHSLADAQHHLATCTQPQRLKFPYACSGRAQLTHLPTADSERFLQRAIQQQGAVLIEPEHEVVCDFSAHYDLADGAARLRGFCVMENTASGQFTSARVSQKWTRLLPEGVAAYLFTQAEFHKWYHELIPTALPDLLPEYHGPIGIDALVYRTHDGELALRHIVEINVRHTMGRLALNLYRLQNKKNGALSILPKSAPAPSDSIPLNDPAHTQVLQAYWASH